MKKNKGLKMSKNTSLNVLGGVSLALVASSFILSNVLESGERSNAIQIGKDILRNTQPEKYHQLTQLDHTVKKSDGVYVLSFNRVSSESKGKVCASYTVEFNNKELLSFDGPRDYQDNLNFRVCVGNNNTPA